MPAYYIGVMSGTSLDGIDVAISSFTPLGDFQFIAAETFAFPEILADKILLLINNQQCSLQDLGEVDIALGRLIGKSINQLLQSCQLSAKDVVAIGSHGQTICHCPTGKYPFSLQLGNANEITQITGINTIADFRQRDIASGGQGAPLVPAFHRALFSDDKDDRVIVNIGGISNITFLPALSSQKTVLGFDTGPGNTLLDYWIQSRLDKSYDENGKWAASGHCDQALLSILFNDAYFSQSIPKSTGRELFNHNWLEKKLTQLQQKISNSDVQATLVELTAHSIAHAINQYADTANTVFICGGGAHNTYLLNRLQNVLADKKVSTTNDLGLHPDWVEACAFSWLAYRTNSQQTGNLTSVTGAKQAVILGGIFQA